MEIYLYSKKNIYDKLIFNVVNPQIRMSVIAIIIHKYYHSTFLNRYYPYIFRRNETEQKRKLLMNENLSKYADILLFIYK